MKKITTVAALIDGEARAHPVHSDSRGGECDVLLTPQEAAADRRVSKSYLDKLRVYGGGPKFLRFGRKILYPKTELDLWAAERLFGSTSEYRDERISSRGKSELMSNANQQRPIRKLRNNSSYGN
jgi:hypothetical protein